MSGAVYPYERTLGFRVDWQGAKIRHQPTNYPWAYEMQAEGIHGNVLRLASEAKENEPQGERLNMHVRRWISLPEGGYKCPG